MLIEGQYQATPQTISDGREQSLQIDANGNLKDTLATRIAGEDIANDVTKVEQRFAYAYCTADTAVKSGAGFLHTITFACTDAAPTAGTIIIYDNTAESGTIIHTFAPQTTWFPSFTITLDVSFATGLYIGFTTTADVNVTVSYR